MEPPERPLPLDYAGPRQAEQHVVVGTFANEFEASLARNRLEQEGIRCFTTGEALLSGIGAYVGAMQKVQVIVEEMDRERAESLLEEIRARRAARLRDPAPPPCPKCGAEGARRRLGRGSLAVIVLVVAGVVSAIFQAPWILFISFLPALYLIVTWDRVPWMCKNCGATFTAKAITPDLDDEDE